MRLMPGWDSHTKLFVNWTPPGSGTSPDGFTDKLKKNRPESALIPRQAHQASSPRLFQGFSPAPENPSPNPEPPNKPETNPNQPNTNRGQEKEACTATSSRKRLICRAALQSRPRVHLRKSTTGRAQSGDNLPEEALAGRTRSRLEGVNRTRENLKPEFGSHMEAE